MEQSILSVRIDSDDKKKFEIFCNETGMNVSVAINMFVKAVLREQRLPFEIKTDPFYSDVNMARLKKAAAELDAGKGTEHELIEVEHD
ncbi:MAG: type II toxin-antitoxin system RelB/DinJ family antitoxin [Thermoflexaceae bacterium]|nr:type II toxin-antitoxin system RelB/DinJ family antitoxin [Thermoflexaceae bacterium]